MNRQRFLKGLGKTERDKNEIKEEFSSAVACT
jgi:hypothetical protein